VERTGGSAAPSKLLVGEHRSTGKLLRRDLQIPQRALRSSQADLTFGCTCRCAAGVYSGTVPQPPQRRLAHP